VWERTTGVLMAARKTSSTSTTSSSNGRSDSRSKTKPKAKSTFAAKTRKVVADKLAAKRGERDVRLEKAAADVDLPNLFTWLGSVTDTPRMEKTKKMLQADSFKLFVEVDERELVGVVRSQREIDLFYSCHLKSDGHFCCVNQNLELCMGMNGYPCKHLMTLILGLATAKRLSPNTIRAWVGHAVTLPARSRVSMDEELLSTTFIKYKGVQAGSLDWRPTETIPEDYYAL
jgi:hypothetical protein